MTSQLVFNLPTGSISFSFTPAAARELQTKLRDLVSLLKTRTAQTASGDRSKPERPIEYQYTGDIFLEIFCNPNIWANPFAAKVLITLRDERIRFSSEVELTRMIEDVDRFVEQLS
jgi:hypothetical protein